VRELEIFENQPRSVLIARLTGGKMQFLAEHLLAAKMVRINGSKQTGTMRELVIQKSNSFVKCASLAAKDRGGISLDEFEWSSFLPDWTKLEEQIRRLVPPCLESPPLVPDLV
jgi:hypothetical protein